MKIYTKTGDQGTTGLFGGKRVNKDDVRIEAYGTVDELNSFIGLLMSKLPDQHDQLARLYNVQKKLFTVGSHLASDPDKNFDLPEIAEAVIEDLEVAMDNMNANLADLKNFILPGGSQANSIAHVCRTITRRAERRVVSLSQLATVEPVLIRFLNRLSDYFFVLARKIASDAGEAEVIWEAD